MSVGGITPSGSSYEPLESAKAASRQGPPSISFVKNQIDEALETESATCGLMYIF